MGDWVGTDGQVIIAVSIHWLLGRLRQRGRILWHDLACGLAWRDAEEARGGEGGKGHLVKFSQSWQWFGQGRDSRAGLTRPTPAIALEKLTAARVVEGCGVRGAPRGTSSSLSSSLGFLAAISGFSSSPSSSAGRFFESPASSSFFTSALTSSSFFSSEVTGSSFLGSLSPPSAILVLPPSSNPHGSLHPLPKAQVPQALLPYDPRTCRSSSSDQPSCSTRGPSIPLFLGNRTRARIAPRSSPSPRQTRTSNFDQPILWGFSGGRDEGTAATPAPRPWERL